MPSEKQSRIPKHPNLWLAKDLTFPRSSGISTGYENLDSFLPDSGWPKSGLVEIECESVGVGELRLLAPVLRQFSESRNQWITWINSPCIPYAPGLHSLGIDIQKILLIHTKKDKDTLWALEKSCRSKSCSAVLVWLNHPIKFKESQRLQMAAKAGGNLIYLFRLSRQQSHSSASELKLNLRHTEEFGVINIDILKRRRGWAVHDVKLNVAQIIDTSKKQIQDIREKLQLWRGTKGNPSSEHDSTQIEELPNTASRRFDKDLIQSNHLQ